MSKFTLEELVGAIFAANLVTLDALIEQGAADKSQLIQSLKKAIEKQEDSPFPAAAFVFSRMISHLEGSAAHPPLTLQ